MPKARIIKIKFFFIRKMNFCRIENIYMNKSFIPKHWKHIGYNCLRI